MEENNFELKIGEKTLKIKIKNWAEQASGSCLVQLGDTEVLATAVMSKQDLTEKDFLPLTVDYEERYYAAGRIFGSRFIKRESRPTDEAILTGRMIDRTIRPRFPEDFKREIQIIVTCLSWDGENDPDILGLIAASTALSISDIPWQGPIGPLRIGRVNGKFIFNPTYEEREKGDMDLVLTAIEAGTKTHLDSPSRRGREEIMINMIEFGGKEISEDNVLEATKSAESELKKLIDFQKGITEKLGKKKAVIPVVSDERLEKEVKNFAKANLEKAMKESEIKEKSLSGIEGLKEQLVNLIKEKYPNPAPEQARYGASPEKIKLALAYFEKEVKNVVYKNIIEKNIRPDGRKCDELRKISCEVGVLPRTHGTGLFSRGLTRVLSILTLGGPKDQQLLEGMEFIGKKRFMHHYNFPPYSSGEISFMRGPKRREIGHGCLAEKALMPLIPNFEQFPYTIRVVSEVLSSNGSTSMASVSAASLALMDAGVPIKEPAAGISIGLVEDENPEKHLPTDAATLQAGKLLVDIQGPEDHLGGMDFKIAGTKNGITAIQMDVKTDGIDIKTMKEALFLAKKARIEILGIMKKTISSPRPNLSALAPKIKTIQINPTKIGEVVGPRGSVINKMTKEFQVNIDIEDSGLVYVTGKDDKSVEDAIQKIKNITREVEIGEVFQGEIKRMMDFGVFVEILPGATGLVHISKLVPYHIKSAKEVVKIGDIIPVKVVSIDELGRINLSAIEAGFKPKK